MSAIFRKVVKGITFPTVVKAVDGGHANVCSNIEERFTKFLRELGLDETPHVLMATHSMGGRSWRAEEGRKPAFFRENSDGGWYALTEGDASYLEYRSATSGSRVVAEKNSGGWTVSLEVPVDESGGAYQGCYWQAFHKAMGDRAPTAFCTSV